jgi:alkyl hydroperoxide reductase subunit AhpC
MSTGIGMYTCQPTLGVRAIHVIESEGVVAVLLDYSLELCRNTSKELVQGSKDMVQESNTIACGERQAAIPSSWPSGQKNTIPMPESHERMYVFIYFSSLSRSLSISLYLSLSPPPLRL